MAKKHIDIPPPPEKKDQSDLMRSLLDYKDSLDRISELITVLNSATYPLTTLQKIPKIVQYVENLRKGTYDQVQILEQELQNQQGL